eukprot:8689501-Alexandrium_andersonii.AAC.1
MEIALSSHKNPDASDWALAMHVCLSTCRLCTHCCCQRLKQWQLGSGSLCALAQKGIALCAIA